MNEQELLYHFPFRIDKENNFRSFVDKSSEFTKRYIPKYDGTNTHVFLYEKSGLTTQEIHDFEYLYENYSQWNNWYKHGRNIFSFSEELLLMLDKTDVNDIKPELFKLPFDIFYLSLKPLKLKLTNDDDAIIEGVYIDHNIWNSNGEHPEGYCDLSFYFVGDFKEIYLKYISTVTSKLQPFTNSDEIDEIPLGSFWNIYLWFQKSEKRETVKEAVEHFLKNLKEEIFILGKTPEQVSDFDLEFYSYTTALLERTINLVINCLLYLSQPQEKQDAEKKYPAGLPSNFDKKLSFAKSEKERKKIYEKIEQSGFSKINFIGQNFKRRYEESTNLKSAVQSHWRRGHWRNQKFGPKLQESRPIWIMPTVVNSSLGNPVKGHLYNVQKGN